MILLGLSGKARSGKDSVADHLVERYGFTKFAFSSALYDEVQEAYGLEDQSLLREVATKDALTRRMSADNCADLKFRELLDLGSFAYSKIEPLSPRQVLQWWGTECRRASDPDYWVKKAEQWLWATQQGYPEQRPQYFVNPTVWFANERMWLTGNDIPEFPFIGNIWHLHRD